MAFEPEMEGFKNFLQNDAQVYEMYSRDNQRCPVYAYLDHNRQDPFYVTVAYWVNRNGDEYPFSPKFSEFIQRCDGFWKMRERGNKISAQECLDILEEMC